VQWRFAHGLRTAPLRAEPLSESASLSQKSPLPLPSQRGFYFFFNVSLSPPYFLLIPSVHNESMTEESIQFHIESNDYFGTIATVLDLLRQDMSRRGYTQKDDETLQRLRDELLILQSRFRIVEEPAGIKLGTYRR
jgi:hypothetical protein